jgi:hypothetical protein
MINRGASSAELDEPFLRFPVAVRNPSLCTVANAVSETAKLDKAAGPAPRIIRLNALSLNPALPASSRPISADDEQAGSAFDNRDVWSSTSSSRDALSPAAPPSGLAVAQKVIRPSRRPRSAIETASNAY